MPDPADEPVDARRGAWGAVKKRWRGWLRAIHRDFGYVAVGFTVIYAVSGLAINHIKDWDPSFTSTEITQTIAPIGDTESDDAAVQRVTAAVGTGKPDDVYRAGDELRLGYASGAQVTVVGDHVTFQDRSPRFFLRIANWLHYNRGKKAWTYVADIYAVMLLYLALSGIFMIKGRLGLRWRGATLVSLGVAAPIAYVALSGGPNARSHDDTTVGAPNRADVTAKPADPRADAPSKPADEPDTQSDVRGKSAEPVTKPARPPVRTPPDEPAPSADDDVHLKKPDGTDVKPSPRARTSTHDGPQIKAREDIPELAPKRDDSTPSKPTSTGLKNPFDDDPPPRRPAPASTPSRPSGPSPKGPTTPAGSPISTSLEKP